MVFLYSSKESLRLLKVFTKLTHPSIPILINTSTTLSPFEHSTSNSIVTFVYAKYPKVAHDRRFYNTLFIPVSIWPDVLKPDSHDLKHMAIFLAFLVL